MNDFPTSCDQCIPDRYTVTTATEYELDVGCAAETHWPKKLTAAHEISTSCSETFIKRKTQLFSVIRL